MVAIAYCVICFQKRTKVKVVSHCESSDVSTAGSSAGTAGGSEALHFAHDVQASEHCTDLVRPFKARVPPEAD